MPDRGLVRNGSQTAVKMRASKTVEAFVIVVEAEEEVVDVVFNSLTPTLKWSSSAER